MREVLLIAFLLALTGCSSTTMVETTYDSKTGKTTKNVYSKFYDTGVWLVPNQLGMQIVADHVKSEIPVLYGVKKSLGALGSDDLVAKGKITFYFYNFTKDTKSIEINEISNGVSAIEYYSNNKIVLLPKSRQQWDACTLDINNYGKVIELKAVYALEGKKVADNYQLQRRTDTQLEEYFGPNGKPPYPWVQ